MPKPSSIETRLADDDKARLNELIAGGKLSIDGLVEWLGERGYEISRSAIGRHKKKIDRLAERLRQSRQISEALVRELGDAVSEGEQSRLLAEITRSLIFDFQTKAMEQGIEMEPNDFFFVAKAQKELAQVLRLSQDFEEKVMERAKKAAAGAAKKAGRKAGISEEAIATIEREILKIK